MKLSLFLRGWRTFDRCLGRRKLFFWIFEAKNVLTISRPSAEWDVTVRMSSYAILRQETIRVIAFRVLKHFWIAMKHVSHDHCCCASGNKIIIWGNQVSLKNQWMECQRLSCYRFWRLLWDVSLSVEHLGKASMLLWCSILWGWESERRFVNFFWDFF